MKKNKHKKNKKNKKKNMNVIVMVTAARGSRAASSSLLSVPASNDSLKGKHRGNSHQTEWFNSIHTTLKQANFNY